MLTTLPISLSFSNQRVGTTSSPQQILVTNVISNPVAVLSVTSQGDFSETDTCMASSPLGPNATCTISVTFSPALLGSETGNVLIANSANLIPISVSLTGTGIAPPPPTISSLSPTSGAVGASVTIAGTNFGTTQGISTVTFNGTTATVISWSAGSIAATVPAGATTGNVVVTVGGLPSNGINFTVLSTPKITTVYPNSGSISPSVPIANAHIDDLIQVPGVYDLRIFRFTFTRRIPQNTDPRKGHRELGI